MNLSLTRIFGGYFVKQGFRIDGLASFGVLHFENFALKGTIIFDGPLKNHRIRWKSKPGYVFLDMPIESEEYEGYVSSSFPNAMELLNFLERKLVWKKSR